MAQVSDVSASVVEEGDVESVSQLPRGRLLMVLAREVCVDVRKVGEYQRMSRDLWRSVRRLNVLIVELRGLGDCGDRYESLNLLERLRLENVEKVVRLRLMMKETQLKITEKGKFIMKLRGNGGAYEQPLVEWEKMFILYCERAVSEDSRLALEINALCDRLTDIIEEKRALLMS
ncbi:hypothetical protein Tco_1367613 [Tanacetum coccineum]